MKPDDLAFVADALLALCEPEPDRPCYSERELQKKLRREHLSESFCGSLALAAPEDFLLRDECREVIEVAKLTPRQAHVLNLRLSGFTFEEIGSGSGRSKQAAQHLFIVALKKIAQAFHVYRYKGLSEVYRREMKRGTRQSVFGRMIR